MQHQVQICSTRCRDAAPGAPMQHQLKRRGAAPDEEMQHQLQRCSTCCRVAAPATEMQHQLKKCSTNNGKYSSQKPPPLGAIKKQNPKNRETGQK